jgi:hypothetical protein
MLLNVVMRVVATGWSRIPLPSRPSTILELALKETDFAVPLYGIEERR